MAYIIIDTCTKDGNCVEVCPVDCIEEGEEQYFINPDECIDCGACEPECPATAIFADGDVPDDKQEFVEKNAQHFAG